MSTVWKRRPLENCNSHISGPSRLDSTTAACVSSVSVCKSEASKQGQVDATTALVMVATIAKREKAKVLKIIVLLCGCLGDVCLDLVL